MPFYSTDVACTNHCTRPMPSACFRLRRSRVTQSRKSFSVPADFFFFLILFLFFRLFFFAPRRTSCQSQNHLVNRIHVYISIIYACVRACELMRTLFVYIYNMDSCLVCALKFFRPFFPHPRHAPYHRPLPAAPLSRTLGLCPLPYLVHASQPDASWNIYPGDL